MADKMRVKNGVRAPKPVNTREGSPSTRDLNKKFKDARNIAPLASAAIRIFAGGNFSPKGANIRTKTLKSPT